MFNFDLVWDFQISFIERAFEYSSVVLALYKFIIIIIDTRLDTTQCDWSTFDIYIILRAMLMSEWLATNML